MTGFVVYLTFFHYKVFAAEYERSENDLILYKTDNYNLAESCTFTGLTGYYELQRCKDANENVPNGASGCLSWNHSYMDYQKVTSKSSNQYKVLNSVYAWTDKNTGLRMYKDRICIAIGQGYNAVAGDYVDIVLDDNTIIKCIVGDMKAVVDTDESMRYHTIDGSVVECIVDYNYFSSTDQYPEFLGQNKKKVTKIIVVNDLYEDSFR